MPRNRVLGLIRVPARDLIPDPKNWRTHPEGQARLLRHLLRRVGMVDVVLARRDDDGQLWIVDGHLRADILGEQPVPVVVLDVNEEEAHKILLTLDSLTNMASTDAAKLEALLEGMESDDAVQAIVEAVLSPAQWGGVEAVNLDELPDYDPDAETVNIRIGGIKLSEVDRVSQVVAECVEMCDMDYEVESKGGTEDE